MKLGLGTGSTAAWFVELLAEERRRSGLDVVGVPTSTRTGELAARLGVPLTTLDDAGWLDLTVDGADEFYSELRLIKGGGGALLQEKIVAAASDRFIVISDSSKEVDRLGAFPLPIEIVPFAWETTKAMVEDMLTDHDVEGDQATLRLAGDAPYMSDGSHFILDLHLERIGEPEELHADLISLPGVIETGLFIDMAELVIMGFPNGQVEVLSAEEADEAEEPEDAELGD
jgi:ribose 5-phosphate isomerase A